jgi:hypothetical protein
MTATPQIVATPWSESFGTCECCGRTSKKIWGDLSANDNTLAVYFVQWTSSAPEHNPNIDLVIGSWRDDAQPQNRALVSLLFRPSANGGSFMVIDGQDRLASMQDLCSRAMRRVEVVGTPLAQEVFAPVDAIWLTDARIAEVQALNNIA